MADEYPDPDEEFDLVHQADYEALRELEGKQCDCCIMLVPEKGRVDINRYLRSHSNIFLIFYCFVIMLNK